MAALVVGALLLVVNVIYARDYLTGAARITLRHWRGEASSSSR